MCGFVAIVGDGDVERGLDAIAHRGPDGRGVWRGDGVALGSVRLAITDPAGGAQPISNEDGSVIAVVNGEIYGEHASWLIARGHALRSRCDAELLVHLYEELGDACVERVRGELAFALWDRKRRRLLAGRDRFGIKPLVWARTRTGIALASEAKALFAAGVPARWDAEQFAHAAHVQYPWPDRTLFAGVHQLEPGCTLVFDGEPRLQRYWTGATPDGDVATALRESVQLRASTEARACVQLSGGLDSTAVAALSGLRDAFTVSFVDGGAYDELAIARETAAQLDLRLHEVTVDAAAIATHWPEAVAHGEGLAINGHLVGKWLLSRAMRDAGFKVALTGEGADELFAGYPHLRADGGLAVAQAPSRGVMLPAGEGISTASVQARLGFVPTWIAAKATLAARVRTLLAPELRIADPFGALLDRLGPLPADRVAASAASWMRTALAQYILRTLGDGMEMAHAIEGRVPFLDHHVANAAAMHSSSAHVGTGIDKPVLRAAVTVPAHVATRMKHPFLAPPLSVLAPELVQDTLRSYRSPLVEAAALRATLDALPAMPDAERQAWDPALMLILSAAILERRYGA